MTSTKTLGILFATVALGACGGGGGGGSAAPAVAADVADKYVGTWLLCAPTSAITSAKITLVSTKTSATSVSYTYKDEDFTATNCAGTAAVIYSEAGSVVYKGTKIIGADVVDLGEATITSDNDPGSTEPRVEKDISLVSGNTIYTGDDTQPLDANGYPTVVFKTLGLTKQ